MGHDEKLKKSQAALQTKNTQYLRNVEIDNELHQKQFTAVQTQELSRTKQSKGEEEIQRIQDLKVGSKKPHNMFWVISKLYKHLGKKPMGAS